MSCVALLARNPDSSLDNAKMRRRAALSAGAGLIAMYLQSAESKRDRESLKSFPKRRRGLNECAQQFSQKIGGGKSGN
jgi:hypothetical protein